jgi:nucleotide-binding universal stress UspA family protein
VPERDRASEESFRPLVLAILAGVGAVVGLVVAYKALPVIQIVAIDRFARPAPVMEARRASNRAWEALARLPAELETAHRSRPKIRAVLGDAAAVLQEVAKEGGAPPLVAVGSRGLNAVQRAALGSVSAAVLRSAGGPVLVVPSPENGSDDLR